MFISEVAPVVHALHSSTVRAFNGFIWLFKLTADLLYMYLMSTMFVLMLSKPNKTKNGT